MSPEDNTDVDSNRTARSFDTGIELADQYLQVSCGTEIKESSAKSYASSLRKFNRFLCRHDTEVLDITVDDVKDFLRDQVRQQLSESVLKKAKCAITNMYKYVRIETEDEASIDLIALQEIDVSSWNTRELPEPEPLSQDELEKLVDSAETRRGQLMILVAGAVGAREESLRKIKLDDVDLSAGELELQNTKSGGSYRIPISSEVTLELERWIKVEKQNYVSDENNPYLFPSRNGDMVSKDCFYDVVHQAAQRAGLQEITAERPPTRAEKQNGIEDSVKRYRVSPHTLRRTFSDLLDKAGLDLEERRDALDHESVETTKEYTYTNSEFRKHIREKYHS